MKKIKTPYYIIFEEKLRHNLDIISRVSHEADVEIIMAFKANALWKTFHVMREYGISSTASSINEMLLGVEELQKKTHTYCPAYTDESIIEYLNGSTHITFNSIQQFNRFQATVKEYNSTNPDQKVSCGLRINPQCSIIDTDIYNPCTPGSRFGVTAEFIGKELPKGIEGFHFHALCESSSYDLEKVLTAVKEKFGKFLPQLKWINMGGGHLMTRSDYNINHLIEILKCFKNKYPNLHIIMEPGSAFTWQTGDLVSSVVDIVTNQGITTAIVDVSFACHMPDCLEMPYKPTISGALNEVNSNWPTYRIGGNSCLSGDFIGDWSFDEELKIGDQLIFEDMNHYTTVKTNMFNGIQHPSILFRHIDGTVDLLREFSYKDYKNRMS